MLNNEEITNEKKKIVHKIKIFQHKKKIILWVFIVNSIQYDCNTSQNFNNA